MFVRMTACAAAIMISAAVLTPDQTPPQVREFLRTFIGAGDTGLTPVERGVAIARSLPAADKRDVAVLGATRVAVPVSVFLERFRNITEFKTNPMVLQIGRFSDPPSPEDLRGLTIDAAELESLSKCRVGDCDLRLPAATIERLAREVKWSTPSAAASATAIIHDMLLQNARDYLAGGNVALREYNDRKQPVVVHRQFESLINASQYLVKHRPDFHAYLRDFPARQLPGIESFLYWSKEKFGFKPVMSVTHVTIQTRPEPFPERVLIASKQIYASHYFDASLSLTAIIEAPATANQPAGIYMLYLNRSRASSFSGAFGGFARFIVQGRSREGMRKTIEATRQRLEAASRGS